MAPTIRVDDDVFSALQKRAKPFVDTPNSVLRRLLGLNGQGRRLRAQTMLQSSEKMTPSTTDGTYRPLDQLRVKLGDLPPRRLRLPNGDERILEHWNSLPLETARYLVKVGRLQASNCPVRLPRARNRFLIHTDPRHPSGERFFHAIEISDGLWLEAHANAPDLFRQTVNLIRQVRDDPAAYDVGR